MNVKLISFTRPVDALWSQGITDVDKLVAYCARVSNPDNQFNTETAGKLIAYLIAHKHWSPLEMVHICLEITTTRDIARQILRHRSFTFQEFSQRYADPTATLGFEMREARLQDPTNRQNSRACEEQQIRDWWLDQQRELIATVRAVYVAARRLGLAKEVARCILPEGLTLTRLFMNGSLRSWIHYIDLRSQQGTQKEHADIAKECAAVITDVFKTKIFPIIEEVATHD